MLKNGLGRTCHAVALEGVHEGGGEGGRGAEVGWGGGGGPGSASCSSGGLCRPRSTSQEDSGGLEVLEVAKCLSKEELELMLMHGQISLFYSKAFVRFHRFKY